MATREEPDIAMLAVFDVESGQSIPVPLEDEGMNTIDWLVEKLENISTIVHTARDKKPSRVKVTHIFVGDMEIKRSKWEEKTIEYYLLFGDPWFTKIKRLPTPSVAELTQEGETAVYSIERKVEGVQNYLVSGPSDFARFGYNCGVEFVDLNATGPSRLEWNSKAPRWRIACNGVCIEGKCENKGCEAYDKMVIINFGYIEFSLVTDAHRCECPLCKNHATPFTCAFNNCMWKWNGKMYDPKGSPKFFRQKDWKIADNAYHVFCPTQTGHTEKWLHLTICAKPLNENSFTCALCSIEGSRAGFHIFECGHHFHKKCLTTLCKLTSKEQASTGAGQSFTCPQCVQIEVHNKYIGDKYRISDAA